MEKLSRVEKHQRGRKSSKPKPSDKKTRDTSKTTRSQASRTRKEAATAKDHHASAPRSSASGKGRKASKASGSRGAARVRKPAEKGAGQPTAKPAPKPASGGSSTPSRSRTYSSQRVRMSKWFVNSLIILFMLLMAGLLWWGLAGAPSLEDIF
ncbi:hypothetical protein ACH6EH_00485 [Paenibacillus sp. JSM ZJ436]|uniref:hypothetical protein n=1 Tax=Paenibacillus sp. JSM ZJ436 TaxID=3376190 RepID=UPI00379437B1